MKLLTPFLDYPQWATPELPDGQADALVADGRAVWDPEEAEAPASASDDNGTGEGGTDPAGQRTETPQQRPTVPRGRAART